MTRAYGTSELELAAFLRGHRLLNACPKGAIVEFEFDARASDDVDAYFGGAGVPARELFGAHRELRTLIAQIRDHEAQRGTNRTGEEETLQPRKLQVALPDAADNRGSHVGGPHD